jgi:type VI protein secretion system component Hcp
MKKATALFAMSAALMSAAPALAASDMFIKFDGVEGEDSATASIESWSFGACNSGSCQTVTSPREASSGLATGKRTHHPSVVASQNTQSLRESPTRSSTGGTAVTESGEATKTNPAKASWDLATNKGARTAASGGVTVAAGDVDGDGRADFAYAGTQGEVSKLTVALDKSSPMLAKVCAGKHFANVTIGRGTDTYAITDSTVSCTTSASKEPATAVCPSAPCSDALTDGLLILRFSGGQMKHTKTGHVTLLK